MQYLSESQYKLVSEFNERVRQSERSIQDRIDRQHNASGPQTPNPLHYVGTNETTSKLSSAYGTAYGTRLETMFNPLATQGIITEEMGTPPQKQLFATVFNESPTHPTEIDNLLTTQSDKPGKKNYSTLQVESNIDYDQRLSSTKQKDSLVNYETKDPLRTSQYNQYTKPNRYDSLYKDTIAQSPSPFQKKSPYPIEENYTPGSGLKYKEEEEEYVAQQQSPNYYESKLDEYLKSQERSQYDSGHKRQHLQDESNSQLVYYLSDEKRRLKVPSIKLYEEGQVPLAFSNKTTPYGSRINEKPNSKDEKEDKMPPLSKSKKEKSKENTVIPERDRPADIKKASPHPKKEKKEVRIQDVPVRDEIQKPSSKLGSVKSPENAVSNGSTSRPMKSILQGEPKRSNSVSSRRKKQGPIKMRSLSREPRENSKLQKSASKSLAKTVEAEPENEKAAVVKDILRKCRLGTLHEDTFVKVLENHMNSSPQLFEDLKSLLKK